MKTYVFKTRLAIVWVIFRNMNDGQDYRKHMTILLHALMYIYDTQDTGTLDQVLCYTVT